MSEMEKTNKEGLEQVSGGIPQNYNSKRYCVVCGAVYHISWDDRLRDHSMCPECSSGSSLKRGFRRSMRMLGYKY